MKQRFVRAGDGLHEDHIVVVRGGNLDPEADRANARRGHETYGTFGISVFAVRGLLLEELAQQRPLVRFARLLTMTAEALSDAGLRVQATGRNPRHFEITFDDPDAGIPVLLGCEHRTMVNPYHDIVAEPGRAAEHLDVDLVADLNAEDDDGLGWSTRGEARPSRDVRPGMTLLAGNEQARAVVRVVAVDDDGQVHFSILPGPVERNRDLLGRTVA